MKVSTKELRIHPGKIIDQASAGAEITVTYRGKPLAKIIPYEEPKLNSDSESIFGMWKEHENITSVEEHIRDLRKGRKF